MTLDLPRRQQQLHDLLLGRGDVPIPDLYTGMTERAADPDAMSDMQRWLGPYITALNRNLADRRLRVEPGAMKATYRLVALT